MTHHAHQQHSGGGSRNGHHAAPSGAAHGSSGSAAQSNSSAPARVTSPPATLSAHTIDRYYSDDAHQTPVGRGHFVVVRRLDPLGPIYRVAIGALGTGGQVDEAVSEQIGWHWREGVAGCPGAEVAHGLCMEAGERYAVAWVLGNTRYETGDSFIRALDRVLRNPDFQRTMSADDARHHRLSGIFHIGPDDLADAAAETTSDETPSQTTAATTAGASTVYGPYSFSFPPEPIELWSGHCSILSYAALTQITIQGSFSVSINGGGSTTIDLNGPSASYQGQIWQSGIRQLNSQNQFSFTGGPSIQRAEGGALKLQLSFGVTVPGLRFDSTRAGVLTLQPSFKFNVLGTDVEGHYRVEFPNLEATVTASQAVNLNVPGLGQVSGTTSLALTFKIEPNWVKLAQLVLRDMPEDVLESVGADMSAEASAVVDTLMGTIVDETGAVVATASASSMVATGAALLLPEIVIGAVMAYEFNQIGDESAQADQVEEICLQLYLYCCGYSRLRRGVSAPDRSRFQTEARWRQFHAGWDAADADMTRAVNSLPPSQRMHAEDYARADGVGYTTYLYGRLAARDAGRGQGATLLDADQASMRIYGQVFDRVKGATIEALERLTAVPNALGLDPHQWAVGCAEAVAFGGDAFGRFNAPQMFGNLADVANTPHARGFEAAPYAF